MQFLLTIDLATCSTRADIADVLMHTAQVLMFNADHPNPTIEALAADDGDTLRDHRGESIGKWEVTETPAADPLETLCECGREPSDCATSAGADYHADKDDFLSFDQPKTYEEFARLNGDEDEDAPEPNLYSVIVGNVGTVYAGDEPHEAKRHYAAYVELSRGTTGRAAGEPVTMMKDGEPIQEHQPATEEDSPEPDTSTDETAQARLRKLLAIYAAAEISEANGARAQLDDDGKVKQDIATCGTCGKSWNDALITDRTPTPAARCPYESIHPELAELARLQRAADREAETRAYDGRTS